MELYKSRKEKTFTHLVFSIYMVLLVWLVIFKFAVSIDEIPHLRGINLRPFYYDAENSFHLREILYNLIIFIPAGFYLTAFFSKKNILLGVAATAALSLAFEIVQWIFAVGASDITDLITNTLGGFCGMLLFLLLGKIMPKHRMTVANALGIVIEILAGLLLVVLLT